MPNPPTLFRPTGAPGPSNTDWNGNAGIPDDLVADSESRLVIRSGAGMENDGTVSVIGPRNTGSLEVFRR